MPNKLLAPSADSRLELPFPEWIDARLFGAATAEDYTVPSGIGLIEVSGTVGFYMNTNGTAAAPGADIADGTGSHYISTMRRYLVNAGDVISVIPTGAGIVTIAGWKV